MFKEIKAKENLHIVFWLIKDFCWSLEFKTLGMIMVLPTVSLAFIIAYKTREHTSDFIHNIAVCFWICANATWMIGEFFTFNLRSFAAILFSCGIFLILLFNIYQFIKNRKLQS